MIKIKLYKNKKVIYKMVESKRKDEYEVKIYKSFDDMPLKDDLLKGIYSTGFENPSIIQQKAIVPLIDKKDLIAQSQSGTGKTGTFCIGVLQRVNPSLNKTQGLILSPTRELARQTYNVIKDLGSKIEGLRVKLSIGGTRGDNFSRWERENDHIIIGTPGRIIDNVRRKKINLNYLNIFVLDEADEMLSKGFIDQIYEMFQIIPQNSQVALFSATIPEEVLKLSDKIIKNPIKILVKKDQITLEGIKQYYVGVERKDFKIEVLVDLFDTISVTQSIIFVNRKRDAEYVYDFLKSKGFGISLITGNLSQDERNKVIKDFREGKTRVLLTTGLLARGFDVQQVSLVINFDLPQDKENYIHCTGRSGRFGRKGIAINLVTNQEYSYLREIETYYKTKIEELPDNLKDLLS
jgi:translation initiation factor 4A